MDETVRMYLLEIVFADGGVSRKHYDEPLAPARVMWALHDADFIASIRLKAVAVIDTKDLVNA